MNCPSCKEGGVVKQFYGLKCVFCGWVNYNRKPRQIKIKIGRKTKILIVPQNVIPLRKSNKLKKSVVGSKK